MFPSMIQSKDRVGLNHNFFAQLAVDDGFTNFHFSQIGTGRDNGCLPFTTSESIDTIAVDLSKQIRMNKNALDWLT